MKIEICYGLKYYVKDTYSKFADRRGGEVFRPLFKKDIKPFKVKVQYAVNNTLKVIDKTSEKYPICYS